VLNHSKSARAWGVKVFVSAAQAEMTMPMDNVAMPITKRFVVIFILNSRTTDYTDYTDKNGFSRQHRKVAARPASARAGLTTKNAKKKLHESFSLRSLYCNPSESRSFAKIFRPPTRLNTFSKAKSGE
jgi:hypothetical protein